MGQYNVSSCIPPWVHAHGRLLARLHDLATPHHPGEPRAGMLADVMIFDPNAIIDRATYERAYRLSMGVTRSSTSYRSWTKPK